MRNCTELPENYREVLEIDLQKNQKTALIVNGLSLLIFVLMIVIGLLCVPISELFEVSSGLNLYVRKIAVLAVSIILYLILHEMTHGVCMKCFSNAKVRYGFTGLYAYAGSDAYFNKKSYLIIALAPVILWGAVLLIIICLTDLAWFWCFYPIQVYNISGAAGDIYVTYKLSKMPSDILVNDTGVAMKIYSDSHSR